MADEDDRTSLLYSLDGEEGFRSFSPLYAEDGLRRIKETAIDLELKALMVRGPIDQDDWPQTLTFELDLYTQIYDPRSLWGWSNCRSPDLILTGGLDFEHSRRVEIQLESSQIEPLAQVYKRRREVDEQRQSRKGVTTSVTIIPFLGDLLLPDGLPDGMQPEELREFLEQQCDPEPELPDPRSSG